MKVDAAPLPLLCCAPLSLRGISAQEAGATAALFKALGDPQRVRIISLLANSAAPVCVCDITAHVGLAQPTVSWHLKKLAAAGLLRREQRGTWAYYSIEPDAAVRLRDVVKLTEGG